MEKIKIDKNVPMPGRIRQKCSEIYKVFENMKVGDSFAIPITDEKASTTRNRLYMSARNFKAYKGVSWVFASRIIENGIRIWRIS